MTCQKRARGFVSPATLFLFGLILFAIAVPARAANEGQADLDKATQQKLGAQGAADLTAVVELCESALKKGLDKGNTSFANDLMGSALTERGGLSASKTYHAVLAAGPQAVTDEAWRAFRSDALDDLEKGVKLSPNQPQALFEIAKLNLLPDGDSQRAMEALDKTIELSKDDANLRAEALLRRASLRKDLQKRLADLDMAVLALPGNAVVWRTRALVRVEAEKLADALADFDKAIAADPKQVSTYQIKAEVLLKMKKLPEALAVLEKGHEAVPDNAELLAGKGRILIAQSNFKAAAEELSRAIAIDGSNLENRGLRAALYEELGEKAKALADIDKVLEIRPGQVNAMHMRAGLLAELGKYDAAIEALQSLHKANPGDSLTMLQMGMLYTNMKKYDKAIETYTAILADRPDDVDATRGRADAQLNSGHRGDAVTDYERALKLKPHDVSILNNFAWVLATAPEDNLRDGHRALALAIDACRQTDYKQDFILSTLAAAYAETGDFESARKFAAQAVEAKPSKNAEDSRKDELKKELDSYKANKPWREALPLSDVKKADEGKASEDKSDHPKAKDSGATAEEKKGESTEKNVPAKPDIPKKDIEKPTADNAGTLEP